MHRGGRLRAVVTCCGIHAAAAGAAHTGGILGIGVQLLFLAMREKWVPSLLEAIMGVCMGVLFAAIMVAMPFNPALPGEFFPGVKIFLAIVIALCLFDAGKKLWQTYRLFIHQKYRQNSTA